MTAAYLTLLGLREPPFTKEIPDADLWLPSAKQAVVDDLVEALHERASITLIGEPGVGKTCVLRALQAPPPRGRLPPHLLPQRHPRSP